MSTASEITEQIFAHIEGGVLDRKDLNKVLEGYLKHTGKASTQQDIDNAIKEVGISSEGTVSKTDFTQLIQRFLA